MTDSRSILVPADFTQRLRIERDELVLPQVVPTEQLTEPCPECDGDGVDFQMFDTETNTVTTYSCERCRCTSPHHHEASLYLPCSECGSSDEYGSGRVPVVDGVYQFETGSGRVPLGSPVRLRQYPMENVKRGDHRMSPPGEYAPTRSGLLWLPPVMFDSLDRSLPFVALLTKEKSRLTVSGADT